MQTLIIHSRNYEILDFNSNTYHLLHLCFAEKHKTCADRGWIARYRKVIDF